ncbi:MAG: class I adenylate-forming enzyme family protein [Rhodocyclaceae bacterium]|nr:class I adenylate-forming enzyme family protein [Rhodocyclaceae bacterium]
MPHTDLELAARYEFGGQDIPALLARTAQGRGNHPFMIWEPGSGRDRTWTYGAFWREVQAVAAGLAGRGVGVGDRLLIHGDNSPEMVIAWYASAVVGATAVTTGTHSTQTELDYFIEQAEPVAAITQPRYAHLLKAHASRLAWIAVTDNDAGDPPAPADADHGQATFEALYGDPAQAPRRKPDPLLPIGIVFTSGTTSRPKAVVHTHANILWAARLLPLQFDFKPEDVHLAQMPFYHLNAQTWTIAVALGAGGAFLLLPRFTVTRYWEVVAKHGVTHSAVMPLLVNGVGPRPPLDQLRLKVFTGSGDYAEAFARSCGARLMGCYGMSELVAPVLTTGFSDIWAPNTLGRPTPGYQVMAVDQDSGRPCGFGEIGELLVRATRGVRIFSGYFRNDEANAKAFTEDGWFRTGDIVRLGEDGDFYYQDRGADRLKVGGENVSALEIERLIASVPGVGEVAVVAKPDPALFEVAVAFVVRGEGAPQEGALRETVLALCGERLSRFKVPRRVYFLAALPKLAIAGKIAKPELRKMAAALD